MSSTVEVIPWASDVQGAGTRLTQLPQVSRLVWHLGQQHIGEEWKHVCSPASTHHCEYHTRCCPLSASRDIFTHCPALGATSRQTEMQESRVGCVKIHPKI
ncbi:uncharacterized protein [Ambystoma mexicanum]|uniref:uncharacterized protein isoform X2 n=1 Tax=Ambystoma mexicanum TaxID=8296 RepID=UPI0037E7F005